MPFNKPHNFKLFLLLGLIGLFLVATRRLGHNWGDDFAIYIHHAKNLVEGRPYADVGLLFDPGNPTPSLRSYPPVLPLVLAPVVAVFGLDVETMKTELIFVFLLALWAIYHLAADLSERKRLLLVAAVGFHPFLWLIKDNILSDIPFLTLCYLSFWFFEETIRQPARPFWKQPYAWAASATTALAVGTRVIGVSLLLAWGIWYALRRKRPDGWLAMTIGLSALIPLWQVLRLPPNTYLPGFLIDAQQVARNLVSYLFAFSSFWQGAPLSWVGWIFFAWLCALAAWGFKERKPAAWMLKECFIFPYGMTLLFCRYKEPLRYLIPLMPFFLYYVLEGLRHFKPAAWRKPGFTALAVGLAVAYGSHYRKLPYGPFADGVARPEALDLFQFVKTKTQASDIFVFEKPRALSLYTDRTASFFHPGTYPEAWAYIHSIQAAYLVTFNDRENSSNQFAEQSPKQCRPVYQNPGFKVWKVL